MQPGFHSNLVIRENMHSLSVCCYELADLGHGKDHRSLHTGHRDIKMPFVARVRYSLMGAATVGAGLGQMR